METKLLDGEIDIKEYIDGILKSNLPQSAKESILDELKEIAYEKNNRLA